MTRAIGIDVGGTKIAAGVVDTRSGVVEARFERGTRPERGSAAVLATASRWLSGSLPGSAASRSASACAS